ncbi:hypothetical protein BSU04_38805 [Caballeronia sordidicola]|uniref:Uncharacterized protein n=1 Tax=Caballeronia sordidicola TaxID=196367 RepID=A0A226WR50_CABSO|nr:hypothetical protein BSU04_38805 [Caballeronia sordidicola]
MNSSQRVGGAQEALLARIRIRGARRPVLSGGRLPVAH